METKNKQTDSVKLIVLVFVLLTAFVLIFKSYWTEKGADTNVIVIGNIILFLIGIFTIISGLKAISNPNPHVFVRVFYTGLIIRLFVCAIAAFIYIYLNDGHVNKISLFTCLGIYMLYTAIEVASLKTALKNNKNA